jgi:small subunit ribosomal protein S21
MAVVRVGRDENVEVAIKKFLNKVKKSGLLEELQERKYFKKPSVKRNEEKRKRKRVLEKLKQEKASEKD